MLNSEIFAACVWASFLGLVWLILGVPGALCCIAAMIVSEINVAWIDEMDQKPDAQPQPAVADASIPVRRFGTPDVRVPVVDVTASAAPPSPFKPRRAKMAKKLPPNVVRFPRKVS